MSAKRETAINWAVTPGEATLIQTIVNRAMELPWGKNKPSRLTLLMDVTACHLNGCPLRLEEMAQADEINLSHDIGGIHRFIDRETGQLGGFFVPRYAVREVVLTDATA